MKPGWIVVGALAVGLGGWFGGPALGRRLDYFNVRRVEVRGARHLAAEDVVRALELPARRSLFEPLEPLQRRAEALGGVARADVHRRLPGTLVIELEEVAPVAFVDTRDGLRMVDERGKTLPFDPTRAAPDLPVAEKPDSLVAGLLGRMRLLDPALYAEVGLARRVRDDVVVEVDGKAIWFRPDAGSAEMQAAKIVAQDLARRGRAWRELDCRYADQVVVRGGDA